MYITAKNMKEPGFDLSDLTYVTEDDRTTNALALLQAILRRCLYVLGTNSHAEARSFGLHSLRVSAPPRETYS